MKCSKCGAKVPKGYVYCKSCGEEVLLVPDYNYLEEDMLSHIIQEGGETNLPPEYISDNNSKKEPNKKIRKNILVVSSVCILLALICLIIFIQATIAKKQANSYEYQFEQAQICLSSGEYEEALVYFENALLLKPADVAARNNIVEIYLQTERMEEAVLFLEAILKDEPENIELWKKLISIYEEDENYSVLEQMAKKEYTPEVQKLFLPYIVETPEFSMESGVYDDDIQVEIIAQSGAEIFYTINGSIPVENGTRYTEALAISEGTYTICAIARNDKGIYSDEVYETYTISYQPPEMPKVSPVGGNYAEPQVITIDVPIGCKAYYTWDGSEPTEHSAQYTGPIEMPQGNQVLSVALINEKGLKSRINRINYIFMP